MATPAAVIENRMNGFTGDQLNITAQSGNVGREQPRWAVFCGDIAHPDVMRKRDDFSFGGEYLGTKFRTLYRTKYLLRKCEMSPLLMAKDFVNEESLNRENRNAEYESVPNPLFGARQGEKATIDHYFHWCYPGEEVTSLISTGDAKDDMGIREFETLRGISESDAIAANLQHAIFNGSEFFPDWDTFLTMEIEDRRPFHKMSALERHLYQRRAGETELRDLIDVYLESCDQYRIWGDNFLDAETRRVKTPVSPGGQPQSYSVTAVKLFDQLEVTREDYLRRNHEIPDVATMPVEIQALMQQMTNLMERQGQTIELLAGKQPVTPSKAQEEVFESNAVNNEVAPGVIEKQSYAIGTRVSVPIKDSAERLEGVIKMKPGGRYVVEFADESKETFEYSDLIQVDANN